MQFLIYIVFYPILWLISILPFRLLYFTSDCVYVLLYHIIGYRKKIVRQNLAMALPHLSEKERRVIEKKSFRHFCDMFMEMAKTMSISEKEINKRFKFTNLELYLDLEKKGKSIALMCAHYASYEWVLSMNNHITFKGYGIYKQITNPYFDKLVKDIRAKFKAYLITTKEAGKTIENNTKNGVLGLYGFASDQTPNRPVNIHWYKFMNIDTPIHTGAESLAKKHDMNMIFLKVKKVKRGYYEASFELLSDDVRSVENFKISEDYINKVEQQICDQPEYYLWTHKRWKHQRV